MDRTEINLKIPTGIYLFAGRNFLLSISANIQVHGRLDWNVCFWMTFGDMKGVSLDGVPGGSSPQWQRPHRDMCRVCTLIPPPPTTHTQTRNSPLPPPPLSTGEEGLWAVEWTTGPLFNLFLLTTIIPHSAHHSTCHQPSYLLVPPQGNVYTHWRFVIYTSSSLGALLYPFLPFKCK